MTQPIQEPTPGREVSGLGYGARQLFRRPNVSTAFTTAWMAVYDDGYLGQTIDVNVTTEMQFPYIDWSDNAILDGDGPFSYEAVDGSIFGKDWAYIPQITMAGLYTITVAVRSDGSAGATSDFIAQLLLETNCDYPGRKTTDTPLSARSSIDMDVDDGVYMEHSWTLPLKPIGSPPEDVIPSIFFTGGGVGWDIEVNPRMWITYLGPDNYAASSFPNSNDPGPYGS